jgi:hypothetical protein
MKLFTFDLKEDILDLNFIILESRKYVALKKSVPHGHHLSIFPMSNGLP